MPSGYSLRADARVLFCGKTGSGKTFAARRLLSSVRRLVVFDSKGTLAPWGLAEWSREAETALMRGEDVRVRVTVPPSEDPAEFWPTIAALVFAAGDCTLYVDEVYAVIPPGTRAANIFNAIWTRGREYRIGAWASTQRPSWVPLFILSEADNYFVFRLSLEEDRKRVSAFVGEEAGTRITDKHGFYFAAADAEAPEYHREFAASAAGGS